MAKNEVLNECFEKNVSAQAAYEQLYPIPQKHKHKNPRRAHFIKLNISIPDEKGVTAFLKVLFLLPIPIWLIRLVLKRRLDREISDDIPMTINDMIDLALVKGVLVDITSHGGEKIKIKTF